MTLLGEFGAPLLGELTLGHDPTGSQLGLAHVAVEK